ncbi:MAG: BLUF domain-containing protein [Proteobacteria bacterium]|nr:BLUF domain-containing protein [Pseudomonadota bacterium]
MLTQLVYTCRPRFDARGEDGNRILREIAENARQHAGSGEISGVTLVGGDWFAQILEGEASQLRPVFNRILSDERQESLRLVDMRLTQQRQFDSSGAILHPDEASTLAHNQLAQLGADDFLKIAAASLPSSEKSGQ